MGKQDLEESDDSWEEVVIKRRKTKKEDLEDLDTYDHLDALACVIRNHKVSARLDRKLKREATTKDKGSSSILKGLVSKEKKRFQIDGFNQDLAYITDRIIAMGFPATGTLEKLYRNDVADIKNFFTKRHSEHHKVYNQCIEKDHDYGDDTFDDYAHYPFWDHNVAPLAEIFKFCKDANQYLESDVLNIIAVHCKAGKSRTGLMICCYLLWSKQFINKSDAINYFNLRRTNDGRGMVIPSQLRYIHYFDKLLKLGKEPSSLPNTTYILKKVIISPQIRNSASFLTNIALHLNIITGCKEMKEIYDSYTQKKSMKCEKNVKDEYEMTFVNDIEQTGDVKFEIRNAEKKHTNKLGLAWLNQNFIDNTGVETLQKEDMDKGIKDEENKDTGEDFYFKLHFIKKSETIDNFIQKAQTNLKSLPDFTNF